MAFERQDFSGASIMFSALMYCSDDNGGADDDDPKAKKGVEMILGEMHRLTWCPGCQNNKFLDFTIKIWRNVCHCFLQ